jgi:WD40 repeat protein
MMNKFLTKTKTHLKKFVIIYGSITAFSIHWVYQQASAIGHIIKAEEFFPVSTLSLSTDGRYVVSIHHGKFLVLWDLKNKTRKILSNDANIYSAQFIANSHQFMWQDIATDTVHIQTVDGKSIKTFKPGFPIYSHLMSTDLQNYLAADIDWSVYTFQKDKRKRIMPSFREYTWGKRLNLTWINDYVLTSGACDSYGDKLPISKGLTAFKKLDQTRNFSLMICVTLWNYQTGKPLYKFHGNMSRVYATLSPDGEYAASIDENGHSYVWKTDTGKELFHTNNFRRGRYINLQEAEADTSIPLLYDPTGHNFPPKDFCAHLYPGEKFMKNPPCEQNTSGFDIKFINDHQYFRFVTRTNFVVLFDVTSSNPRKYLKLDGQPGVAGAGDEDRIDYSIPANRLVMGSNVINGFYVYQYQPKDETIKLVMAPKNFFTSNQQRWQWLWWPKIKRHFQGKKETNDPTAPFNPKTLHMQ